MFHICCLLKVFSLHLIHWDFFFIKILRPGLLFTALSFQSHRYARGLFLTVEIKQKEKVFKLNFSSRPFSLAFLSLFFVAYLEIYFFFFFFCLINLEILMDVSQDFCFHRIVGFKFLLDPKQAEKYSLCKKNTKNFTIFLFSRETFFWGKFFISSIDFLQSLCTHTRMGFKVPRFIVAKRLNLARARK